MNHDAHIILDKELRRDIDAIIQRLKQSSEREYIGIREPGFPVRGSRERSLCVTKLQEAVMWLGMDLKAISEEGGGGANPYPDSKDPSNTKINPTADGLKL